MIFYFIQVKFEQRRKMFKFLIIFAFVPAILAAQTPVQECVGGLPMPDGVFFGDRDAPCLAAPCNIPRSRGFAVTYVEFTTSFATSIIRPRIRATVFGGAVTIVQELPDHIANNPCSILTQGSCPLAAAQQAAYRLELPVDPTTPLIPSQTEITLFGDNDQVIFCYRLATQLVA